MASFRGGMSVPVILRPQAEESYSTELLLVECFLSETGVLRSFAALRMTVKRGPFSVERRAGACPRPAVLTDL